MDLAAAIISGFLTCMNAGCTAVSYTHLVLHQVHCNSLSTARNPVNDKRLRPAGKTVAHRIDIGWNSRLNKICWPFILDTASFSRHIAGKESIIHGLRHIKSNRQWSKGFLQQQDTLFSFISGHFTDFIIIIPNDWNRGLLQNLPSRCRLWQSTYVRIICDSAPLDISGLDDRIEDVYKRQPRPGWW